MAGTIRAWDCGQSDYIFSGEQNTSDAAACMLATNNNACQARARILPQMLASKTGGPSAHDVSMVLCRSWMVSLCSVWMLQAWLAEPSVHLAAMLCIMHPHCRC